MWRTFFETWGGHPTAPVEQLPESQELLGPSDAATVAAESDAVATVACPDLVGMSTQDARRVARPLDLLVEVEERAASQSMLGRVIGQSPAPGANVVAGEIITVAIGAKPQVVVPDVSGLNESEALAALHEAGLVPARRVARPSSHMPEDCIVKTRPRHGASVAVGTRITYVVSAAPRRRRRPRQRDAGPVRARRLPDGTFLTLPGAD